MSKAHGKGLGITINSEFTSEVNKWKQGFVTEGLPVVEFKPLTSFPAKPHVRQAEIDAFCRAPSKFA